MALWTLAYAGTGGLALLPVDDLQAHDVVADVGDANLQASSTANPAEMVQRGNRRRFRPRRILLSGLNIGRRSLVIRRDADDPPRAKEAGREEGSLGPD